ncbi:MAG: alpha/beta fold hydrolase [Chloroflexaceae bacterium]|jgi:polyhydroxyalkanoate synthase|nr:alpha/beta fold hydrolase [Chloroflexaceae bacterium]
MTTGNGLPPTMDPAVYSKRLYDELERIYKSSVTGTQLATNQMVAKVGMTPKETVWTLNKSRLYRFYPQVPPEQRKPIPLFLVFALINRPYIFDLRPGNSFVEFMLKQGYDIFMLDWGTPGPEDASLDMSDFALDYLPRAVRKMQSITGSREFSMLGWCIGAALAAIYSAGRPDDGLRNLMLLTAPLDFADKRAGAFNVWLQEPFYNVDALVKQMGNIPGEMIDYGSKMLKPVENFIGNYIRLWDNLDDPAIVESWMAMNAWVSDNVSFPGAAFRQWVVEFFRENRLMEGTLMMRGQPIKLENIRANLLNVIADKDHIVPSCQSVTAMDKVGSPDKELLTMRGGHIGIMAGSGARKTLWPKINEWLAARSM